MKFVKSGITTIIMLWMFIPAVFGQTSNEITIRGEVQNQNNEPVPFATVAVYDSTESEILVGTTSEEDGTFELEIASGSYVVQISYVSFQKQSREIELTDEPLDLGIIVLQSNEESLDEVVVRGERSYMQMDFDSRSFNVGQDITSLGGSALDVLDNVPSITTDFEGNVSLRGNQGVQILINGRPSSLVRSGTDALGSIPANLIEEVEIITNPSARYGAEGTAGIINIKLVENLRLGFNGSIQANTGHPQDHGLGVNLNYHRNNINWFMNADVEYERDPSTGSSFQSFSDDTTYAYSESSESIDTERELGLNFGADYFITKNQILTFSSRISFEIEEEDSDVFYTDYDTGTDQVVRSPQSDWGVLSELSRDDIEDKREGDYDLRLQYENRIDGSDHRFTADADFEFGSENEEAQLLERITSTQNDNTLNQRTFSDENYREFRLDSDYRRPLGEDGRFEAGFRINFDWMDNDYSVEELQNGNWVRADDEVGVSDNFIFFENVNAAYTSAAGETGKFSYQLGLRAENTRIQTELTETADGSDQNYLNLFPSAFLSYSINEANSVQVSYSRRISRPRSYYLLPFTEISDVRNQRRGNPNLRPEFSNSYETGYLRYWESGSVLTSVYYRHRTDVIERVSNTDNTGITISQPINLATEEAWGVEFSADQELFNSLQLSGSLNLFQSNRDGEFEGEQYSSESESFYSRMRLRWRFLESWNLQGNMFYRGARQTTQGRRDGSLFFGGAIAKEFFDGNATLSLNVRDLFNSRLSDREVLNPNSYTQSRYQWSSRSFRLNFRYNFSSGATGGGRR